MKYKLSKDEFEQLSEELQGLYKANGDEYVLEVEGMPEAKPAPKTTKKEKEQAQKILDLESKLADIEQSQQEKQDQKAKENGDTDSLLASSEAKIKERDERIKQLEDTIANKERENAINGLFSEHEVLNSAKPLLSRHFTDRLIYKDNGLMVTDENGNPTVNTLDDLVKEAKSQFPELFVGSAASGGGAIGGDSRATRKPLKEYSIDELDAMTPEERQEILDAAENE